MSYYGDKSKLEKMLAFARKREDNDDHLTDEERSPLVDLFRKVYPEYPLPEDMTDAFVEML